MSEKDDCVEFNGFGMGVFVLALCFGVGSCDLMEQIGKAEVIKAEAIRDAAKQPKAP